MTRNKVNLGERGWLTAADTILVVVLMVWIQGWWDTLRFYSEHGYPTLTAEVSLVVITLIAITCLVNIYYIWRSSEEELPRGIFLLALFTTTFIIAANLAVILWKGLWGTAEEPIIGSSEPSCITKYVVFGVLSIATLAYAYYLLLRPSVISHWGLTIASFFTRIGRQRNGEKGDSKQKRT
jgi:hypothetical protein